MKVTLLTHTPEPEKLIAAAAKDIHESDLRHLEASAHAAQYVAGRDGWVTVECAAGERYRTREDIAAEIRGHIEALLHV